VETPAVGPEGGGEGEVRKAEKLKAFLAGLGFPEPREMRAPDKRVPCGYRPSLSYMIPGQDTSRTFWILAHLDVVPPGDRSLWKTDPFQLVVEGDTLIGRGVEDNHQGVTSALLLGKTIVEQKIVPPLNLGLLFIADEENGNKFGLEYIMREYADLFKKGDLFLVPDAGKNDGSEIEVAEKSILWLKTTVEGKQCHASTPDEGINSLRTASDFVLRLKRLETQFDGKDPLFHPPRSTFEPTKKESNVENVNTIPGRDVFYIDCRVLPTYDLREVIAAIETIGDEIARDYGVRISYEEIQSVQAPAPTASDSDIVKRLTRAIRTTYGVEASPIGIGGGTLAAILRREGHEAAVWSKLIENAHQPNERALISAMLGDAAVMARVLFGS
jgi:succinyl-diaminopimelate desuccinylase